MALLKIDEIIVPIFSPSYSSASAITLQSSGEGPPPAGGKQFVSPSDVISEFFDEAEQILLTGGPTNIVSRMQGLAHQRPCTFTGSDFDVNIAVLSDESGIRGFFASLFAWKNERKPVWTESEDGY